MTGTVSAGRSPTRGDSRLALGWAAAAVVVCLALWSWRAEISNDAVQAINGATHLRAGSGYATSILFFDEHYRPGTLPAPQTVWPPGYSLTIAGLSAFGLDEEAAARLIPRLAYVLLLPLMFLTARRLLGETRLASIATLWLLGITELWMYLTGPNSDLPFMAALMGAVLLIPEPHRPSRWLWCSALGALAVWFRYAGLFLMLALGLFVLADFLRDRATPFLKRWRAGWYALPGAVLVGLLLARNTMLVGNPQGGNTKVITQPVLGLAQATVASFADLLGGVRLQDLTGGPERLIPAGLGLVLLAASGVGVLAGGGAMVRRRGNARPEDRYALQIAVIFLVYLALVFFTATRSMISYGPRLLLPAVPLLILLTLHLVAAWKEHRPPGKPGAGPLLAAIAILVAVQVSMVPRRWDGRIHATNGSSAAVEWLRTHTGSGEAIMAIGDGQHVGYAADRPTVVVAPARWTAQRWDSLELRCVAERYGVRAVVVAERLAPADYPPDVQRLSNGETPPWLIRVESSGGARIYRPAPELTPAGRCGGGA